MWMFIMCEMILAIMQGFLFMGEVLSCYYCNYYSVIVHPDMNTVDSTMIITAVCYAYLCIYSLLLCLAPESVRPAWPQHP